MTNTEELQAHWQDVWSRKASDFVSWYQPDPAMSLAMIAAAGLSRNAPIVDVGGGASTLVDNLLEVGYRHLAVLDIAEAALAEAHERLGEAADEVTWIVSDLLAWRPVPQLFELWHDRAVFHFLTDPADRRRYRAVVETALVPGGQVVIAAFAPDGPDRCSGLPVQRHDGASIAEALGDGFRLEDECEEIHHTPAGGAQRFRWCRLRKI